MGLFWAIWSIVTIRAIINHRIRIKTLYAMHDFNLIKIENGEYDHMVNYDQMASYFLTIFDLTLWTARQAITREFVRQGVMVK